MNIADTVRRMMCPTRVFRRVFSTRLVLVAYTLLLIVVIFVVPPIRRWEHARATGAARAGLAHFATALDAFKAEVGRFPTTEEGLVALAHKPCGEGTVLMEKIPRDPWGDEYRYICPGENNVDSYDLSCLGPDGKPGTDDDITNWSSSPE
jgi:general secretion pathway protein G